MVYTKQSWTDGSGGGTPLSASRLNYIEDGIEAAAYEEGVIDFDDPDFTGTDDDDTLDNLMTHVAAQTYKPTIRLRHGVTTLNSSHQLFTGFALIGAGGPVAVEQKRSGNPYASLVDVGQSGTAGSNFLFTLPAGNTHRVTMQGISWEGDGVDTSWLGSTASGVLWTSTLRDLAFSAFYSVLGSRANKLLNTAIMCDGWWNINNSIDTAVVVGGSDSIFWVGSNFLLDSPTSLNGNIPYHMWFDYQEKTVVGGAFVTAEQEPAALRVTGSNSGGTDLIFSGMRFEGRNASSPSYGSVIHVEGGKVTFRDCWTGYANTAPGSAGKSGSLGAITVTGGEALFDNCTYAIPTGETVDDPWIGASGASTKVIVRNMRTADDGVAWSGALPKVHAASGATIDADGSVDPASGSQDLTCDHWLRWAGTTAEYDALSASRKADPRWLFVKTD